MPPSGTPEWEAAMVARLHAGDEGALRELMEAYFDAVADVAFRYVRTTDAARDVAQELFIRLWERRSTLSATGRLVHYLRRAARNAALDVLDHDAARARLAERLAGEYAIVSPYTENRGESDLDADELNRAIHLAVEALSPRVREVVLLHLEQGLAPGEIARLLGVAPRTVYNQLRKGMQHVAGVLDAWRR